MSTKTDITKSEASLSLEERFSALGNVVGKLSKCIDDRNAYINLLENKLNELKIHVGLPKNATYEELSAKIKASQQDLGKYSQFYSSLVEILDLSEKADFSTVLKLATESYDAYNQMTASVTLDQLSTKIDANAKLLKDILKLHSASTSDEIENDKVKVEEKVADYTINLLLKRPNYATVLGSGLLSGLVCAGIGLLMWYKAPDPDEVHVHQRLAAESEIAFTYRALEIPESDKIGNYFKEARSYISSKLSSVSEIAKQISPSQPAAAEAKNAAKSTITLILDAMNVVVGSTPPLEVVKKDISLSSQDTTPPNVSFKCSDNVTFSNISTTNCKIKIGGETEPVTCYVSCPTASDVPPKLDNVSSNYKFPLSVCSPVQNEIKISLKCIDKSNNISESYERTIKVNWDIRYVCGKSEANHYGINGKTWRGYKCMDSSSGENCLTDAKYVPKPTDTIKYFGCGKSKQCCLPKKAEL